MTASTTKIHPYAQHLANPNAMQVDLDALTTQGSTSSVSLKTDDGQGRTLSGLNASSEVSNRYGTLRNASAGSETRLMTYSDKHSRSRSGAGFQSGSHSLSPVSVGSRGSERNALSTSSINLAPDQNIRNKRSKSVDLSQLYLGGDKDVRFTSTNELVADESHKRISAYLGNDSTASLLSRQKTIEMYKENVRKSKNPDVLFQYSQYMLQTALTLGASDSATTGEKSEDELSVEDQRKQLLKEALHYLKKLSVKGYKDAQYLLADSYSSGVFGKVNQKEAFILFQASAKHGHIEAAYRTSICFEEGLGTTRDSRKCIEFLKFAASRNHPAAMFKLGVYAFYGRMGLPDDIITKKNGLKWLSRAVAKANSLTCAAPYELAKIYETGFLDILIADRKYAMELYVQAASLGHMPSATLLGQIYEHGNELVPADCVLSVNYYTIASHGGDPDAMMGLCAWYLIGAEPAFEADDKEAFEWALRAARLGHPKAQFTVGYFYDKGKGTEMNQAKAQKWYQIAADNKDPRALSKLRRDNPAERKSKTLSAFSFNFMLDGNEGKGKRKSFHLNFDQEDEKPLSFVNMDQKQMDHSSTKHAQQPSTFSAVSNSSTVPARPKQKNLHSAGKPTTSQESTHDTPNAQPIAYDEMRQIKSENNSASKSPLNKAESPAQKKKSKEKNKKGCIVM